MNKTTKGSLAAGAAAVLLLGGAGSLAYWTDNATVDGTSITSGYMKLTDPDCGDGWLLEGVAYTDQLLVPGDTLTKSCTFVLNAEGDNLLADFDVDAGDELTGDQVLLDELVPDVAYTVNGGTVGTSDVAVANADVIGVDLEIDWPYGVEDNDSNVDGGGLTATLDQIVFTVTQSNSTGNN
ncbi:alternate-type signal peptide domain-containing protein [Nocardioides sp.]|uniref:alternate-type signal peptide domain-containing protein n=1 Tax=Nocardioides sp. TaxID=35761 RepID=UPI003219B2DF